MPNRWKYDPATGYVSHVDNEEINRVCRVVEDVDQWQHKAGNLIAAAPELLEALEACAVELAAHEAVSAAIRDKYNLEKFESLALTKAQAAIAKATGK